MKFSIWAKRDTGPCLNAWVGGGRCRHGPACGGDIDIGEKHLLVSLSGFSIERFADLIRGVSEIEKFSDEESLEVMPESVDGISSVFLRGVQAFESLVMAKRADGKGAAHPLVATCVGFWEEPLHSLVHPLH